MNWPALHQLTVHIILILTILQYTVSFKLVSDSGLKYFKASNFVGVLFFKIL